MVCYVSLIYYSKYYSSLFIDPLSTHLFFFMILMISLFFIVFLYFVNLIRIKFILNIKNDRLSINKIGLLYHTKSCFNYNSLLKIDIFKTEMGFSLEFLDPCHHKIFKTGSKKEISEIKKAIDQKISNIISL